MKWRGTIDRSYGRQVEINGQTYLNFSTTAYLGLSTLPVFNQWVVAGMQQFGVSLGQSPLSQPTYSIYEELEKNLAHYYGSESALLFANGYSASQVLMQTMSDDCYQINYGAFRHPSLQVDQNEEYEHSVFANDLVDPITATIFKSIDFPEKPRRLIIDASHGFGLLDDTIRAFVKKNVVISGSLNKGFSTPAGLVLCRAELKEQLQRHNMYATSSLPSPALCYALNQLLQSEILARQQRALHQLVTTASSLLNKDLAFPVITFANNASDIFEHYLSKGILIWHNQYPKGSGQEVNRAVLHAALQPEDIEQLVRFIN